MKKIVGIPVNLLIVVIVVSILMTTACAESTAVSGENTAGVNAAAGAKSEMRGVWVATVLNIDYPSVPSTDPEALKNEAVTVLDNAKKAGFNAVFLQVRPASDALYKSKYFPWSKYLTGVQGTAPDGGFDPLEYWITEAHNRGLQLHAWINPYRITKRKDGEPRYDFASLDPSNPARLHPDWVVQYSDGNLYYNPGIPEVRRLIVDSVLEIVNSYAVDGIHFDDYFYPGTDFNDKDTFTNYGSSYGNIDDWRRDNVNTLIGDLSREIKATGKNVRFGISPFGIWANKSKYALGSDTNGMQSYTEHYADSRKWVKDGMIDYIAPQIYWNIGFSAADYSKLLTWWKDVVSGTAVDLYLGQAAYREGSTSPSSAWYGVSEMEKQLRLNEQYSEVKGSIFYNYKSLADNPALTAVIRENFNRRDGVTAAVPVMVSRPGGNLRTSFTSFYLNGSSDPAKPLLLNGIPVENRSDKGYFGVLIPLAPGPNVFTLSQDGSYATRVIYRTVPSSAPAKLASAAIPKTSAFPQSQEYRMSGEKITLACTAPAGSRVTVKLSGKTYTMTSSTKASSGKTLYSATYKFVYTVPSFTGTPRVVDLGYPVYTMKYGKTTKSTKAPAKVGVIMKNAPFYAQVAKTAVDTYRTPVFGNGAADELYSGMTDNITGQTAGFIRLSSGLWITQPNVKVSTAKKALMTVVTGAVYSTGEKWDTLKLDITAPAAATAAFDGNILTLKASMVSSTVPPSLPEGSLFSSVSAATAGNGTAYTLTLAEGQRLDGFYIEKTAGGLTLNIKRHPKPDSSRGALGGITILLDPGHGGGEYGAIGPLGTAYAEKTINLNNALKLRSELEKLGATVLMTRSEDRELSLNERLTASRNARPDLFLSVHANSMEDNVDISKIVGFSAYYHHAQANAVAQGIYDSVIRELGRNPQGVHAKNFYVMRGNWAPSILFEAGFVPNPTEFEWLTDDNNQQQLAASVAKAIAAYFAN